jgi:hypothetical protein
MCRRSCGREGSGRRPPPPARCAPPSSPRLGSVRAQLPSRPVISHALVRTRSQARGPGDAEARTGRTGRTDRSSLCRLVPKYPRHRQQDRQRPAARRRDVAEVSREVGSPSPTHIELSALHQRQHFVSFSLTCDAQREASALRGVRAQHGIASATGLVRRRGHDQRRVGRADAAHRHRPPRPVVARVFPLAEAVGATATWPPASTSARSSSASPTDQHARARGATAATATDRRLLDDLSVGEDRGRVGSRNRGSWP